MKKYIVSEGGDYAIFNKGLVHAAVARQLGFRVIGAGFTFTNPEGDFICQGESISLGIKSRGAEDEEVLNRYDH